MAKTEIQSFFTGQTIFLTGGSGFLGKVLIEKLLRTCYDLNKIFILVRNKNGKTTEERTKEIFQFACFDQLKEIRPNFHKKITIVNGDCSEPYLGLRTIDRQQIEEETTIVINAAANVKFDQNLRSATKTNIYSVNYLISMAKKMPNLIGFLHVSTAYSHCVRTHINEVFYETPMATKKFFAILENLDDPLLNSITPLLLGKWPNTYVYTKAIAEEVIREETENLPVIIIRPAIISCSYREPIPGWVDNMYGIIGIVVAVSLGVLRSLQANPDLPAQIVPVDIVANNCLIALWHLNNDNNKNKIIYNNVPSKANVVTWQKLMKHIEAVAWNYPTKLVIWYYTFGLRKNFYWHKIVVFFLQTVPAYIVDFIFLCIGKQPIAVKNYQRMNKVMDLLTYFSTHTLTFSYNNVTNLWKQMSNEDRELFPLLLEKFDMEKYIENCVIGGRVYLLKDPLDTLDKGHRKIRILRLAHYTILTILFYLGFKIVQFILSLFFF